MDFEKHLPIHYKELSDRHWSSESAIIAANEFLCHKKNTRILDIGSGVGKFCILGALKYPHSTFIGVEKRNKLVEVSNQQKIRFNVSNCQFTNADIRTIDFSDYSGFYFFNSFLEYIDSSAKIDSDSYLSREEYIELNSYLFSELSKTKPGTRIVTFHCTNPIIPESFRLVATRQSRLMKFYLKDTVEFNGYFNINKLNTHIDKQYNELF